MIKSPLQIRMLSMGLTLCKMGGGGGTTESQQSTSTSTQLTNNVSNFDSKSVASDRAIAIGGDGNTVDQRSSTITQLNDSGNTTNTDSSTKTTSTIFTSNTSNNMSDYGSVAASLSGMKETAKLAMGDSTMITFQAMQNMKDQNQLAGGFMDRLFTTVGQSSANSQGAAVQALGLATVASKEAAKTEKDSKQMLYIGAAIIAAIALLRKK